MPRSLRLVLFAACALALAAPGVAAARAGGVTRGEALAALQAAEAALATPLAGGGSPTREATSALRDLAVALPELRGARHRRAAALLSRPTDPGRSYFGDEADGSPICNPAICVHWTDKEENAPESPQFVQAVVDSTNLTYAVENGTLGWQPPRSDGTRGERKGVGGEGQVDVYITNLGRRLYGYAAPDPGQKGTSRFAYLVLDNNYLGFPSSPLDSLKVTVAHEYNHILQFNYDTFQDVWMFESTATWAEQQVYPEIDDYLNYLPAFAKGSQAPMTGRDIKIYAEAVWNHWLSSRYGVQSVRDAWAASGAGVRPAHLATAAYSASIAAHGGRAFAPEFGTFAAATAEWRANPAFPDAARYPDVRRRGAVTRKPREVVLDNTSYRLARVEPGGGSVSLRVRAPERVASTIALVGRIGPADTGTVTTAIKQLPRGGLGTVSLSGATAFTRVTAVIADTDGRVRKGRDYVGDGARYRYLLR